MLTISDLLEVTRELTESTEEKNVFQFVDLSMNIAIIGAGFCGVAVAWHLLSSPHPFPNLKVTLFDAEGIGAGASGVSAGLLHPYAGAHAKLNWRGKEGFEATCQLLSVASRALNTAVTAEDQGILRLALTSAQQHDFQHSPALQDPQVEWLESPQSQALVKGCVPFPGLWIQNGLTVYPQLYLQGLWTACMRLGAQFEKRHLTSLSELKGFSLCIVAAGAAIRSISELKDLPLKSVKGQVLELEWPHALPKLPCALNSHIYILMKPSKASCLVGATYEKEFADASFDLEIARREILPKAALMLPPLSEARIIGGNAGLRAVSPNHLPFIKQVNSKTWVLTGMGSKGLLYHALMAKELVQAISIRERWVKGLDDLY
ncbi:MAG: NAD(P)/FAD-dependent oxidoreductase [Chlamydiales bacterium]